MIETDFRAIGPLPAFGYIAARANGEAIP